MIVSYLPASRQNSAEEKSPGSGCREPGQLSRANRRKARAGNSSQSPPGSVDKALIRFKANHAPTGSAHGFHKTFRADPFNGSEFAVVVEFFNFAKLTGRDVYGIVGLDDARLQNLWL